MDQYPLVSICSPCYNHEAYLEDYFKGIISQTYARIELILIDDASQDNSVDVIKRWLPKLNERFERVVFIENEKNQGIVKNCNKAILEAKGDYIKLFATDDIMLNNEIQVKIDAFIQDPEIDMLYGNGYIVKNDYSFGQDYRQFEKFNCNQKATSGEALFQRLLYSNFIPAPTCMIKKSIFTRFGLYDESINQEDYEYWVRISRFAKIGYISKPTICYRRSVGSTSNFSGRNGELRFISMWGGKKKVLKKYIKYISPDKRKSYIDNFYRMLLTDTMEYNYKDLAIRTYRMMKKLEIKLENDEKRDLILFLLNPFSKINIKKAYNFFYGLLIRKVKQ